MKVGITGGAGFIGTHIAAQLTRRGDDVVVFDHRGRVAAEFDAADGEPLLARRSVMLGDVRDSTAVTELAAHVDGIIHLAAVLGTQETIGNPWPAAETNILGGINILNAVRQYDLPLVYAGVGNFQMRNTYSTTKTCIERLVEQYRDNLDVDAVVVRPMNAYGPGQSVAAPFGPAKVRKIMPAFVCRALSGMPIEVYGDGSQISDMVYVTDVAQAFIGALDAAAVGNVPDYPVEVGPATSTTVRQIAETVVEVAGSDSPIVELPMRPGEAASGALQPHVVDEVIDQLEGLGVHPRLARQVARPLSNRVNADAHTLRWVGMSDEWLTDLRTGVGHSVDWYRKTRGAFWRSP